MAAPASNTHPYANDPSIDFTITLWEEFPAIKDRSKLASEFVFYCILFLKDFFCIMNN